MDLQFFTSAFTVYVPLGTIGFIGLVGALDAGVVVGEVVAVVLRGTLLTRLGGASTNNVSWDVNEESGACLNDSLV